jgi:tRNA(Ile)-lysidine synthase
MKGKKLVSDFLTDRKLSILQKKRQLCVIDSTGQIIWLVNHRINNTNRITDRTIKIIRLRYTGEAKSEK